MQIEIDQNRRKGRSEKTNKAQEFENKNVSVLSRSSLDTESKSTNFSKLV